MEVIKICLGLYTFILFLYAVKFFINYYFEENIFVFENDLKAKEEL